MDIEINTLATYHQRKNFNCGEPSLDQYIRQYAKQDTKRHVSRVFVASPTDEQQYIIGYYTLSAGSLDATSLPLEKRQKLPKYPIPIAVLGRLAINQHHQGQGFGTMLLADALKRVCLASQVMAVYAVIVDALDHKAQTFYEQFGFIQLPNQPLKLFMPLDTITNLYDSSLET